MFVSRSGLSLSINDQIIARIYVLLSVSLTPPPPNLVS